jgi:hypothetical protein
MSVSPRSMRARAAALVIADVAPLRLWVPPPGADGSVEFFGTWMSRDRVWVAPEDAQNEIIRQWKQWFARHGNSHRYESNRRVESWYF